MKQQSKRSKNFVLKAKLFSNEIVVLQQQFESIDSAEKFANDLINKRKFIGDDSNLYYYNEIQKFQIINKTNLQVEKEIQI